MLNNLPENYKAIIWDLEKAVQDIIKNVPDLRGLALIFDWYLDANQLPVSLRSFQNAGPAAFFGMANQVRRFNESLHQDINGLVLKAHEQAQALGKEIHDRKEELEKLKEDIAARLRESERPQ